MQSGLCRRPRHTSQNKIEEKKQKNNKKRLHTKHVTDFLPYMHHKIYT